MLPSYIDDRHQPQLENNNEPALFSEHEINKELTVNIFGKQTSFNSLGKNYTGKIALSPSIRRAVIFAQSSRTPTPVFISGLILEIFLFMWVWSAVFSIYCLK